MSGPATPHDEAPSQSIDSPIECEMEVVTPRRAAVGGFDVGRVLPQRSRRMVGAWCFVDVMGPGHVTAEHGLNVGPHPHIGLQTVTWLIDGALLHRDSLGSEQLIRPGQLNLMTAGHGVSHSEETNGVHSGALYGVQLWVALPSATRDGKPAFEHHAELPEVGFDNAQGRILIGQFAGSTSPARRDTDHFGVELTLRQGQSVLPLVETHEHAILALDPGLAIGGRSLAPSELGYLGVGHDELVVDVSQPTRALLIGGEPFSEQLLMWWNYVARTRQEIVDAHREWSDGSDRFGSVATHLPRIDTAAPPWP